MSGGSNDFRCWLSATSVGNAPARGAAKRLLRATGPEESRSTCRSYVELDFAAMAAEQASLAARFRGEAAKPENGSRRVRRLAVQQAKDCEASAALFVRCAGASSVRELRGLMLRAQRHQKRITAISNRILLGGM